jgi:hypothetical protein
MTPISQRLEPPANPGRFRRSQIGNLGPGRWYEFEADELML